MSYDAFWDSSKSNWYRCGYSLGDVIRVDMISSIKQKILSGEIGADENVESGMLLYPREGFFEGDYESGYGSIAKGTSSLVQDKGQFVCSLTPKKVNASVQEGGAWKNIVVANYSWLRCMNTVQDFQNISINTSFINPKTGLNEGRFINTYCCVTKKHPEVTHEYVCSIESQRADRYCCECFGYEWKMRNPNAKTEEEMNIGFCIGDGYCDTANGESIGESGDCCEGGSWLVDSKDPSYTKYLNPGTQGYPVNDNICHAACHNDVPFTESSPRCDGNVLIQCDSSRTQPFENQYVCSGMCEQQKLEIGCGPSTVGPGGELYSRKLAPESCGFHPCDYLEATGKCVMNKCSKFCGAECESDDDCPDSCGTNVLYVSRKCLINSGELEYDCKCVQDEAHSCTEDSHSEGSAQCGGNTYHCIDLGGNYLWVME